ncbi:MAG: hypothetical protein U0Q47_12220 [Mycobacterium sp.]
MTAISIPKRNGKIVSSLNHAAEALLGLKMMYRAVGEDEWNLFASLDEMDPPDPEQEGDASFPTDPAVLAADLAKLVPGLYSPFLWREERQSWPLPAVWRQEVYNVSTGDVVASAEYTQHDLPAAEKFSHLRWVVSYFDDESEEWVPGRGDAKTEEFWKPIVESLPGIHAIKKALVGDVVFRMIVPLRARNLPDTYRWRAEVWDGKQDCVIASTELPWSEINEHLDLAVAHLL